MVTYTIVLPWYYVVTLVLPGHGNLAIMLEWRAFTRFAFFCGNNGKIKIVTMLTILTVNHGYP